jgi:transcriptional regulator GlxA family with amidase domain
MAISNRVAIDLNSSKYVADEAPFGGRGPALRLEEPRQIKDRPLKQRRLTEPHHNRRTTSPVQTPVEPKEIGFYLYPGFSALDLSGPLEVFATSGSVGRTYEYRTILLSRSGGPVTGSGGIEVMTVAASTRTLDTRIVVGASDLGRTNDEDIGAIRTYSATARRTASVCTGAFLVASTGAADGRRLATHWQSAERLQRDFLRVNVECDRLFVRDGPIWSSAGMTAAIDLALALVEDDYGRDLALAIARNLIPAP